eukprot:3939998-Karenia_brevis.AAC.1
MSESGFLGTGLMTWCSSGQDAAGGILDCGDESGYPDVISSSIDGDDDDYQAVGVEDDYDDDKREQESNDGDED